MVCSMCLGSISIGDANASMTFAQGQSDAAQRHGTQARAIAQAIERSPASSGLDARLHVTGEWQ